MNLHIRMITGIAACGLLIVPAGCSTGGAFPRLDSDHNGTGSPAEFDAYMKQAVFTRVDASGDARITQNEWQDVNPKVDAAKFRKVDRDRDGAITRAEANAAFDREGTLGRLFKQADANADGSLSRVEVSAFQSRVRHQPGTTSIEKLSNAAAKP